jgi:hypothetical protein
MDGFRAYRFYLALKLHFTTEKYNVFESKGAVKTNKSKFELRNDRFIFDKIAKKFSSEKELIQFMASNFIYGNQNFVYSGPESDDNYIEWQRRKQSITKILSDDCQKILTEAEKQNYSAYDIFYCTKNVAPYIIYMYAAKQICIESVCILDEALHFTQEWNSSTAVMLLLGDEVRRIQKSKGFIKYDVSKTAGIINNLQQELVLNQNG